MDRSAISTLEVIQRIKALPPAEWKLVASSGGGGRNTTKADRFAWRDGGGRPENPVPHGFQIEFRRRYRQSLNGSHELNITMLAQYIEMAMEVARYEIIEDDGSYWGEIPGFQGVWAKHQTLSGCQRELRETLSDWLALRLRLNLEIPELGRLNLNRIGDLSCA